MIHRHIVYQQISGNSRASSIIKPLQLAYVLFLSLYRVKYCLYIYLDKKFIARETLPNV